jgi:hypothetical protein
MGFYAIMKEKILKCNFYFGHPMDLLKNNVRKNAIIECWPYATLEKNILTT